MRTFRESGGQDREPAPQIPGVRRAGVPLLLALQRGAGNAAVVTLVQRCGPTPCDCPPEDRHRLRETRASTLPTTFMATAGPEQRDDLPAAALQRSTATIFRQAVSGGKGPGGHDPCLDLLQAIVDLLDAVAKRFRDAQDDRHELFKFHRHRDEAHPEHGYWDGHRDKFNEERRELRRKIAEWDANDDCGGLSLSEQQKDDLREAREFGDKEFPTKPARVLREAEESEQESIWDKLRALLPDWVVKALIVLSAIALAVVLVVAFATGVGEVTTAIAGVGLVLGLAIKAAMRASGVRDTSGEV